MLRRMPYRLVLCWLTLTGLSPLAWSLDVEITQITLGPTQVQIAVQTDLSGLPMWAFHVRENGAEMTLDPQCSTQAGTPPQWTLCYTPLCCIPNEPQAVQVRVAWKTAADSASSSYTRANCPEDDPARTPVIQCYGANPQHYTRGVGFTMCAVVDLSRPHLIHDVKAAYYIGACADTVAATPVQNHPERFCVAIPPECTDACSTATIVFSVCDVCGTWREVTCRVQGTAGPPFNLAAWAGNPQTFTPGDPVTVCAVVEPSTVHLRSVGVKYWAGTHTDSVNALWNGSRWCYTIPGEVLTTCEPLRVLFVGLDSCWSMDLARDTLTTISDSIALRCSPGNPATFTFGQPLTVCAVPMAATPTIIAVTARYWTGRAGCDGIAVPVTAYTAPPSWCAQVPAACLPLCDSALVRFVSTGICGGMDSMDCWAFAPAHPPEIECFGLDTTVCDPGNPLTVCATVTDLPSDVVDVTVQWRTNSCALGNFGPATPVNGRWCTTLPDTCTLTCDTVEVIFRAEDLCGSIGMDTCLIFPNEFSNPFECSPDNPDTFYHGESLTVCVESLNSPGSVASMVAYFYDGTNVCDQDTADLVQSTPFSRWCATVESGCLPLCDSLRVAFIATSHSGFRDSVICWIVAAPHPPSIVCWYDNPDSYAPGQPLTACAVVTDLPTDPVVVTASWSIGVCATTGFVPAYAADGRWCITIPAECTAACEPAVFTFIGTDDCGMADTVTCTIPAGTPDLRLVCWVANPDPFLLHQPLTLCATPMSALHDIATVTAKYLSGIPGCVGPLTTTHAYGPERWCLVIPPECLPLCEPLQVRFIAADVCGRRDSVVCEVLPDEHPPEIACWAGNPTTYTLGAPLTVCAAVTDPVHDIDSVRVMYSVGTCVTVVPVPAFYVDGRWCVTVDGFCTGVCTPGIFHFKVWDSCLDWDTVTCVIPEPPVDTLDCDPELNPTHFAYNQPLLLTAMPTPGDGTGISQVRALCTSYPAHAPHPISVTEVASPPRWAATIPAECLTSIIDRAQVTFVVEYVCGPADSNTCEALPPDTCCEMCATLEPLALEAQPLTLYTTPLNVVASFTGGTLKLNWNPVPGASYYQILSSPSVDGEMRVTGISLAAETAWHEEHPETLPERLFYMVRPMEVAPSTANRSVDLGQWEMNDGTGDFASDHTPNLRHAYRWPPCPPDWGVDTIPCDIGYMHFDGEEGHPDCYEHLRVENANDWYTEDLQVCLCIRLTDQPTVESGPYYLLSNNSFGTMYGGFALRIDPGWLMVNGVREYHNRLTAMVWNRDNHAWMTIQSPPPQAGEPDRYSVPVGEWVEICWVIDGVNSMLLIDGLVVATGDQWFHSDNNGAPLIIGAGYRHHTYPIEYPFRGDIDCIRIISRGSNGG